MPAHAEGAAAAAPRSVQPPKPTVAKVTPGAGPIAGGTVVTIKGKHLRGVRKVLFGSAKGEQLKIRSDRKLTVVAPPQPAGSVTVRVQARGGRSNLSASTTFAYQAAPALPAAVTPPSSPPGPPPAMPPATATLVPLPPGGAQRPEAGLSEVECPAVGECVAVGTFDEGSSAVRLLAERLAAGQWTASELPLPSDAQPLPAAGLSALDCPSPTFCVAVGEYAVGNNVFRPLVETWDGSGWSAQGVPLPADASNASFSSPAAISCGSTTSCVAVGSYPTIGGGVGGLLLTLSGSTWTASAAPVPAQGAGVELFDVSCAEPEQCVAVGDYWEDGPDQRPVAVTLAGSAWTAAAVPVPANAKVDVPEGLLQAVDCPAVGSCTAVGGYTDLQDRGRALVVTQVAGAWTPSAAPEPAPSSQQYAFAYDIACSAPSRCTARALYAGAGGATRSMVVRTDGAAVSSADVPAPAGTSAVQLDRVSCRPDGCAAVGQAFGPAGSVISRMSPTGVSTVGAPVPPGSWLTSLEDVALDPAGTLVAVGAAWFGGDGGKQGLAVVQPAG